MITLDDLLVLGMIALAAAYLLHRVWRRLHPRPDGAPGDCAGCSGCGPARGAPRSCGPARSDGRR